MNWHQLYTRSTPRERYESLCLMLQTIEARRAQPETIRIHFINPPRNRSLGIASAAIITATASSLVLIASQIGIPRALPFILVFEAGTLLMLYTHALRRLILKLA